MEKLITTVRSIDMECRDAIVTNVEQIHTALMEVALVPSFIALRSVTFSYKKNFITIIQ